MEEYTTTLPEGTMEMTWGLASPGSGEARRKVHSQSQPCLDLRADRRGGEVRIVTWRRERRDYRGRDYRERGEFRARVQRDILIKSLERVAKDAEDENGGWNIRLMIFVGGTCVSVIVKSFNDNMNELHVIEECDQKRFRL